jgi:hypothetical protein
MLKIAKKKERERGDDRCLPPEWISVKSQYLQVRLKQTLLRKVENKTRSTACQQE